MLPRIARLILLVPVLFLTGCALLGTGQNSVGHSTGSAVTQASHTSAEDGDEPKEDGDSEDEWGFVGKEARKGMTRERDHDRWWKEFIMSQRARDIETSLGID